MNVGDVVVCEISAIKNYGICLEYEGCFGLVRVVDVTWELGEIDLNSYGTVGLKVPVVVKAINGKEFSASLRDVYPDKNPWLNVPRVGQELVGLVDIAAKYGYLISCSNSIYGLLKIENASKAYKKGESIRVIVKSVDQQKRRIEFTEYFEQQL